MRTPMIAGNWKMHKTLAEARELVKGVREGTEGDWGVDVLVCPPAQLLFPMAEALESSPIMLGAKRPLRTPGSFHGRSIGADAEGRRLYARHHRPQ